MQSGPEQRWSTETERLLRKAGWRPGRSVPTAEWERVLQEHDEFEIHPDAQRFLAEFGGLSVTEVIVGAITVVRSEVSFDPTLAQWDQEIFEVLSEQAGAELYPVGMTGNRNAYLGMTSAGTVYTGMDDAYFLAESGDQALEKIFGWPRRPTEPAVPGAVGDLGMQQGGSKPRWSAKTNGLLEEAGWYPGRSVSTAEWERGLR
ncbi:SUKH-3 domain-containing protein, partial [Streptomyces sp. NPDC001922]|uniref:SUKH-3 domain-containing protein n=1 Tax=Streptomyces sp. NPDC001922 TaxID=3364624 RepID=UPI003697AE4B